MGARTGLLWMHIGRFVPLGREHSHIEIQKTFTARQVNKVLYYKTSIKSIDASIQMHLYYRCTYMCTSGHRCVVIVVVIEAAAHSSDEQDGMENVGPIEGCCQSKVGVLEQFGINNSEDFRFANIVNRHETPTFELQWSNNSKLITFAARRPILVNWEWSGLFELPKQLSYAIIFLLREWSNNSR